MITLTRTRWIPENSQEIKQEGVDAIGYLYISPRGKFCVVVYKGKANKPMVHEAWNKEENARASIKTAFDSVARRQATKLQARMDRKNFAHTLQVGDVLEYSWGYDQTNVEFFEVVAVLSSKSVSLRPIGQNIVETTGSMTEMVAPAQGHFIGEAMMKRVMPGNYVRMDHGSACKWDGRPQYQSHYA